MESPQPQNPQAVSPQLPVAQNHHSKRLELSILGIGEAIFPIIGINILIQLIETQKSLGDSSAASYIGVGFFFFVIVLAVVQLICGVFSLDKKLGDKKTWFLIIAGLVATIASLPVYFFFIIYPTYEAISSI